MLDLLILVSPHINVALSFAHVPNNPLHMFVSIYLTFLSYL